MFYDTLEPYREGVARFLNTDRIRIKYAMCLAKLVHLVFVQISRQLQVYLVNDFFINDVRYLKLLGFKNE